LSTYGAVSLFSTVLTNALEQQKINIIQHFESRFVKNEKQTGVEAGDFVLKHEGNRIQHSFNSERADKLAKLESCWPVIWFTATLCCCSGDSCMEICSIVLIISERRVQIFLHGVPSMFISNFENFIPLPQNLPLFSQQPDKFASRGGAKFNARIFLRGFGQFNGDGSRGQQQQFVGKCFYCNQQGH
jgi:hypothetical protein